MRLLRWLMFVLLAACASGIAAAPATLSLEQRLADQRASLAKIDAARPPHAAEQSIAIARLFDLLDEAGQLDSDEALALAERDLELHPADADRGAVANALALGRKAKTQLALGTLADAEATARHALAIVRQQPSVDADAEASAELSLGAVLTTANKAEEATPLLEQALKQLNESHASDLRRVRTLQYLAYDYRYFNKLDLAQTAIDQAMAATIVLEGADGVLAADDLTLSAMIARSRDDVAGTVAFLEHALTILRDGRTKPQATYTRALLLLAQTLRPSGDHRRAESLYREGIAAEEPHPSAGGARLAGFLAGVGLCLGDDDRYAEAVPYLERALALYRKVYGPDSINAMSVEISLSSYYAFTDRLDDAVALLRHVVDVSDRAPPGSAIYTRINARPALGDVLVQKGGYAEAEQNYRSYLARIGNYHILGEIDPRESMEGLAVALWGQGRDQEAFVEASSAEQLEQRLVRTSGADISESHAIGLRKYTHGGLDWVLAIAAKSRRPDQARDAWSLALESRGIVTTISARRLAAARASADPELAPVWNEWKTRDEALVQARVNAARDPSPTTADALDAEEHTFDIAERALAHAVGAKGAALDRSHRGLDSILAALPPGMLLVSFVEAGSSQPADLGQISAKRHARLYAFAAQRGNAPQLIDLGSRAAVDQAVQEWLAIAASRKSDSGARNTAGKRLRELIWDPVAAKWPQRRVLVVPSTLLERVPFAALPARDGHYLVETGYAFHFLDHERDALRVDQASKDKATLSLIGAPDFTLADEQSGARGACAGLREATFSALPNAAREIEELRALWTQQSGASAPTVLTGAEATEEHARAVLPGSRIIHFATHGLYLGAQCKESFAENRGLKTVDTAQIKISDDASDLSALVLSGANRVATRTDNDGLLTSEEIATLDLSGTDWVVLSACDSGIGKDVNSEGVFGLRRAFRLAGSHSIVMSLWPVDDRATADWMVHLYRARLGEHATTMDAVRAADLALIKQRREAGLDFAPFYWAAFVAAGDWR